MSRVISFIFILLGGAVAFYAQAEERQNTYILILGIVLLMIGLYRISSNIPSKQDQQESTKMEDDEV